MVSRLLTDYSAPLVSPYDADRCRRQSDHGGKKGTAPIRLRFISEGAALYRRETCRVPTRLLCHAARQVGATRRPARHCLAGSGVADGRFITAAKAAMRSGRRQTIGQGGRVYRAGPRASNAASGSGLTGWCLRLGKRGRLGSDESPTAFMDKTGNAVCSCGFARYHAVPLARRWSTRCRSRAESAVLAFSGRPCGGCGRGLFHFRTPLTVLAPTAKARGSRSSASNSRG